MWIRCGWNIEIKEKDEKIKSKVKTFENTEKRVFSTCNGLFFFVIK